MAKSLTINDVKYAKPKDKEYLLADGRQGLYLRVLPTGGKCWIYKYKFDGKSRKKSLGTYPDVGLADARDAHAAARLSVRQGFDPSEPPPLPPTTFTVAKLIDEYKTYSTTNKASSTSTAECRGLERLVLPAIGELAAIDVRRAHAIKLIESIEKNGMAAQILKYARSMFTYALNRELVEFNPFSAVASAVPSVKLKSRSRVLVDSELKHLWEQLTSITDPRSLETRRALLLILVTGQRPNEVASMHRREIRVGVSGKERCRVCERCGVWTIPFERIKTRNSREEDHIVYLTPLAMKIIGDSKNYIFIGPGEEESLLRQALSHFVVDHNQFGLTHWTPNDLRRTCATGLSGLGCPDEIIDVILNHTKKGVIATYNRHKYKNEKRHWLTIWGEHLQSICQTDAKWCLNLK